MGDGAALDGGDHRAVPRVPEPSGAAGAGVATVIEAARVSLEPSPWHYNLAKHRGQLRMVFEGRPAEIPQIRCKLLI